MATTNIPEYKPGSMGVLRSADDKEYDAATLVKLAQQMIPSLGEMSGGVYGTSGETVGFRYDDVKNILKKDPTPADQVLLDMARGLLDQGITDISQLSVKNIRGESQLEPVYDGGTNIVGYRVTQTIPGMEDYGPQTRYITPEEAEGIEWRKISGVEDYGPYEREVPFSKNVLTNRELYAGDKLLASGVRPGFDRLTYDIGETYSGPGRTLYRVEVDPETGKPQFRTYASKTGEGDLIKAALTMMALAYGLPQIGEAGALGASAGGGGAAELASVGATGSGLTGPITSTLTPSVPSAFDAAVNAALSGDSTLGAFGGVGTGGFGTAIPSAAEVAAGLTSAGFAPGTAANLAGQTLAGVGAASAPAGLSILDAIRAGKKVSDVLKTITGGGQTDTSGIDSAKLTSGLINQGLSMLEPGAKQYALPGSLEATYLKPATGGIDQQQNFLAQLKQLYPEIQGADNRLLSLLANRVGVQAAEGGHIPEFITGKTGFYVQGRGDGQSDDIPAMLADGEYVFDADTVAALGNGSNKAGAAILDKMRENIRKHKRSAPTDKIPPKAKSPLEYLKG